MPGESPIRRPRSWFWLLAVSWIGCTAAYWWHFVPAVPERVIPLENGQMLSGHTADGSLVLARSGGLQRTAHFLWHLTTGPLEIVDPISGQLLNSIGNETWKLDSGVFGNHAVFHSDDGARIVDLRTGRSVWSRPVSSIDPACLSGDGRLLALASGERVSVVDLETGEEKWSRAFPAQEPMSHKDETLTLADSLAHLSWYGRFLRIDFQSVGQGEPRRHIQDGLGRDGCWLNGETGEIESRFQNFARLTESPDGRYVLVDEGGEGLIISLADNREVCRIPVSSFATFNCPSTEIHAQFASSLSRWSIPDGKPLGTIELDPSSSSWDFCVSKDGLAYVTCETSVGIPGQARLREAFSSIGLSWIGDRFVRIHDRAVQRSVDGTSAVLLATSSSSPVDELFSMTLTAIGSSDLFAVSLPDRLLIFRFDPPRNWWWLAGWGLGPIVVAWTWRRVRRRRETRQGV